ncbi:MAG: crosslink repair DNA glycosylase YcaQ family protein [bacterium]
MTRWLTRAEAAAFLVGHAGLRACTLPPGEAGVRALLAERRCIQLDPLDRIGTNADLVVMARVDGVGRGDVFRHLYPGGAFEHFAKERCLLPATAFAAYRDQAVETPWWRSAERHRRVPPAVVEAVLAEVEARGPVTPADLTHRGSVEPIDWSGWKSTSRLATMALEILWTRCQVVTCGRRATTASSTSRRGPSARRPSRPPPPTSPPGPCTSASRRPGSCPSTTVPGGRCCATSAGRRCRPPSSRPGR